MFTLFLIDYEKKNPGHNNTIFKSYFDNSISFVIADIIVIIAFSERQITRHWKDCEILT